MRSESIVAGIDLGSRGAKCVLLNELLREVGRCEIRTMPDFEETARKVLMEAIQRSNSAAREVAYVATTGLGRHSVSFRQIQITDVTCSARGARRLFPEARFVLDVGAQSTRAIRLGESGKVSEFRMNEKCAAGSGGFLERTAKYLEVELEQLGALSAAAKNSQPISSVCAVLAESEIINHISEGRAIEDIIRGVHESLAERALMLLKRVGLDGPVALVGGVALQKGMVEACRRTFGVPIMVSDGPQFTAATGAAILGWQRVRKLQQHQEKRS